MGERAAKVDTWRALRRSEEMVGSEDVFGVDDVDVDVDVDAPRTNARGVLNKPTTNARLKFRVARVE